MDAPPWATVLLIMGGILLIPFIIISFRVVGTSWPTSAPTTKEFDISISPHLQVDAISVVRHEAELIDIDGTGHSPTTAYPTLIEIESSLIPNRPLQVAMVYLEFSFYSKDDKEKKERLGVLGPPVYAESINLPHVLKIEEMFTFRFLFDGAIHQKPRPKKNAKLIVFAAGQYWESKKFSI